MRYAVAVLITSAVTGFSMGAKALAEEDNYDLGASFEAVVAQAALADEFDALYRLCEELVFWQGVAIMGAQNGWTFSYNTAGTEIEEWTYRLYNARDETAPEAKRAYLNIQRSRVASDDQKAAAAVLFSGYEQLNETAGRVFDLLAANRDAEAAAVFEAETLQLRRDIANHAYSETAVIGRTIRDARLTFLKNR